MGFGQTSLSGVRHGFMPPQLKTKQEFAKKFILIHNVNVDSFFVTDFNFKKGGRFFQIFLPSHNI
jgi:hypothetical protein